MMASTYHAFKGGLHLEEHKSQSMQHSVIRDISLASEIILPLENIRATYRMQCNIGTKVLKGDVIAVPVSGLGSAIHAPTSGTIASVEKRGIIHFSNQAQCLCIIIHPDNKDRWKKLDTIDDYTKKEPKYLIEHISNQGIVGLGGAAFPTAIKLKSQSIDTLIINGAECEPYITADHALMIQYAVSIIQGIEIISYILGNPHRIVLAIEMNKPDAIEIMRKAAEDSALDIEIASIPTKYPSGSDKLLAYIVTGKEIPKNCLPSAIGVASYNVGTCHAITESIYAGKPLVARVTTVTGSAVRQPSNYLVPIGTPIEHVLKAAHLISNTHKRTIIGGPMMGIQLEDLSIGIDKGTNCIIAYASDELSPPSKAHDPCIRCGECDKVCPTSLLPQQLLWYSQQKDIDKLKLHNLSECIECGACSYVCPSKIPLVQYYRFAKAEIMEHEKELHIGDISRQRFEFRKKRLENIAHERKKKRAARVKNIKTSPKNILHTNVDKATRLDVLHKKMERFTNLLKEETTEQGIADLKTKIENTTRQIKILNKG